MRTSARRALVTALAPLAVAGALLAVAETAPPAAAATAPTTATAPATAPVPAAAPTPTPTASGDGFSWG